MIKHLIGCIFLNIVVVVGFTGDAVGQATAETADFSTEADTKSCIDDCVNKRYLCMTSCERTYSDESELKVCKRQCEVEEIGCKKECKLD